MTITELTPVEILADALAVPCDGPNGIPNESSCGGNNPAEWVLFMATCCVRSPNQLLFCTACRDVLLSWVECQCEFCGAHYAPGSQVVLRIEPIGGTR